MSLVPRRFWGQSLFIRSKQFHFRPIQEKHFWQVALIALRIALTTTICGFYACTLVILHVCTFPQRIRMSANPSTSRFIRCPYQNENVAVSGESAPSFTVLCFQWTSHCCLSRIKVTSNHWNFNWTMRRDRLMSTSWNHLNFEKWSVPQHEIKNEGFISKVIYQPEYINFRRYNFFVNFLWQCL